MFRFTRSPAWATVTYWSLDLETGGLDPQRDAVLAVGMVPVRAGAVVLGDAYASLVRPGADELIRTDSIRAHHLVPSDVAAAPPPATVVAEIESRLREGALLVHSAPVDLPFLRRLFGSAGRRWPSPPIVDTVNLLWSLHKRLRFQDPEGANSPVLHLGQARERLGLPPHHAHDALSDAVATAELFLVLASKLGARTLRDLR